LKYLAAHGGKRLDKGGIAANQYVQGGNVAETPLEPPRVEGNPFCAPA
jgi:hypothetical protein